MRPTTKAGGLVCLMAALALPALTAAATTTPVERTCLARRERLDATRKEALDHRRGLVVGQPGRLRHRRDERGCGQRFPSPIGLPHQRSFHTAF